MLYPSRSPHPTALLPRAQFSPEDVVIAPERARQGDLHALRETVRDTLAQYGTAILPAAIVREFIPTLASAREEIDSIADAGLPYVHNSTIINGHTKQSFCAVYGDKVADDPRIEPLRIIGTSAVIVAELGLLAGSAAPLRRSRLVVVNARGAIAGHTHPEEDFSAVLHVKNADQGGEYCFAAPGESSADYRIACEQGSLALTRGTNPHAVAYVFNGERRSFVWHFGSAPVRQ